MFAISRYPDKFSSVPKQSEETLAAIRAMLSEHEVRETKEGPLWSPTRYSPGSNRSNTNVLEVSCLVLDIDVEVELDELRSTWKGLTYGLHSTFSHSPKKHGYRAVFPLKVPIPAADFELKYSLMVARLAGSVADPACKDISRMYYLPSCPEQGVDYKRSEWSDGDLLDPTEFTAATALVQEVRHSGGNKPWDRYVATTDWSDLLSPGGATEGKPGYWTRPGKSRGCGCSAHVLSGSDLLYVFTSNWPPFEASRAYSKLDAYAAIHHGGDVKKACKQLAKEFPDEAGLAPEKDDGEKSPHIVKRILDLLDSKQVEFFADSSGDTFATVPDEPSLRCVGLSEPEFRDWLCLLTFDTWGKPCSEQSVSDALTIVKARSRSKNGTRKEVFLRAAHLEGQIIVDLADEVGTVVQVDATGWRLIVGSPVKFRTSPNILNLPIPVARHDLATELKGLFNVKSNEDLILLAAWLVAFWAVKISAPIVGFRGQPGSGKSSAIKRIHWLVDPSLTMLRNMFANEKDLKAHAKLSQFLSYDNLSAIRQDQSDNLCKLITGGTISNRANYTDDGESYFSGKRRVGMTSVSDVVTAEDLTDRCIFPELVAFGDSRISDDEIERETAERAPYIIAAILDCISCAFRNLPNTKEVRGYRLCDFARFVAAAAPAMGFSEDVVSVLTSSKQRVMKQHAEESDLGWLVERVIEEEPFQGKASELHKKMKEIVDRDSSIRIPAANKMRDRLTSHRAMLASLGISFVIDSKRTSKSRGTIKIWRDEPAEGMPPSIVTTVIPSQIPHQEPEIFELDPFENDDSDDSDGYREEFI